MKGKIKILSLILAVTMLSSMFVSCKSKENSGSGESGASKTESKVDGEKPAKTTEISWYTWGVKPNQADVVEPVLNEKSMADIGVKVNFKWQTGDDASLRNILSSGDSDVDLVFACGWFADFVGSAQKNFFQDITTALPEYAPEMYKKFPKVLWDGVTINNKIYGIPVWKDIAASQYWFARTDILEAAGAAEVFKQAGEKLDTLTPTLEKIKAWHDKDPAKNLYSEGNTAPMTFNKSGINGHNNGYDELSVDLRIGVKLVAGNTKVQSFFTDPDYIEMLKTLKSWADKGLTNGLNALTLEEEPTVATVGTAQGWDGSQYTAWGGPVKGYDVSIQKKVGPFVTTGYIQGGINCIGAGSKKTEATLKYVEYINTNPVYRNMLTYGVEGKNWRVATDDDVKEYYAKSLESKAMTEADVKERITMMSGKTVQRLTGQDWAPGGFAMATWDILTPEIGCPPDMYTKVCDMVNTATPSDLVGFIPNVESMKTQIGLCTSVMKEYQNQLQCGNVKDVDATVETLLKKLNAQGYQEIIAEYQKQADAFLAGKK